MVRVIKANWDRLATYTCFSLFGVLSLLEGPIQSRIGTPVLFSVIFDIQLIAAGVMLIIAVFNGSYWLRITGYVIYLIGMLTISAFILFGSGSPIWIIVLGFTFQGAMSVRYVANERKLAMQLAQVARSFERRQDGR